MDRVDLTSHFNYVTLKIVSPICDNFVFMSTSGTRFWVCMTQGKWQSQGWSSRVVPKNHRVGSSVLNETLPPSTYERSVSVYEPRASKRRGSRGGRDQNVIHDINTTMSLSDSGYSLRPLSGPKRDLRVVRKSLHRQTRNKGKEIKREEL